MIGPLSLLALFACFSGAGAAQEAKTPVFRVAIKISGDSAVASEVESWVKHELNLFKDIEITDSKPDYTLYAIAMVVKTKDQADVGVAITWLSVYHPKGFFEACSLIEDYRLLTIDKEDIRPESQSLIARFNSKSIEPHRKIFQKPKR